MKKKRRTLLIILAAIVLVIVAGLLLAGPILSLIVKTGFEAAGPRLLGTETRLDQARLKLFGGEIILRGLYVANPEGFSDTPFFKSDTIKVGTHPTAIFDKVIHVRELLLDAPEFTLEYGKNGSNVGKIMDHLKGDKKDRKPGPGAPKKKRGPDEKMRLRIDRIELTNVRINIIIAGQNPPAITIGKLTLPPIGGEEGVPTSQVLKRILTGVAGRAEQMADIDIEVIEKAAKEIKGIGKKLFGD